MWIWKGRNRNSMQNGPRNRPLKTNYICKTERVYFICTSKCFPWQKIWYVWTKIDVPHPDGQKWEILNVFRWKIFCFEWNVFNEILNVLFIALIIGWFWFCLHFGKKKLRTLAAFDHGATPQNARDQKNLILRQKLNGEMLELFVANVSSVRSF